MPNNIQDLSMTQCDSVDIPLKLSYLESSFMSGMK